MAISVQDYYNRRNYDEAGKPLSDTGPNFEAGGGGDGFKPKPKPTTAQVQTTQYNPNNIFSTNPELSVAVQRHSQIGGDTWYDRMANNASAAVEHFSGGGQQAPNVTPPTATPLPTTREVQADYLKNALATSKEYGYGGIIPSWNSPTGKAIDTNTGQETTVDIGGTPPKGWLDRALAASKSGQDTTYKTGAEPNSGQYGQGEVKVGNPFEPTRFSTPSGGTIGFTPKSTDNPFIGDRPNLLNAINQSKPKFNPDEAQKKADQYQGGY